MKITANVTGLDGVEKQMKRAIEDAVDDAKRAAAKKQADQTKEPNGKKGTSLFQQRNDWTTNSDVTSSAFRRRSDWTAKKKSEDKQ